MKTYQHIEYYGRYWGIPIVAFDKLDGTNIRIEYSQKRGFYKFGTRKTMFDVNSKPFGFVIALFRSRYEKILTEILKSEPYKKIESFVCYFELIGAHSAFGQHEYETDEFNLVLIDVDMYKKGMVPPEDFIRDFSSVGIPNVVFRGQLTQSFVDSIENETTYLLNEGVVCKGFIETRKGVRHPYYCKIKTKGWMQRLKNKDITLYTKEIKETETFNEYEQNW